MILCDICSKPFTKESSRRRHVSYCRQTQGQPRVRPQSCQSCNAAKVKCSFQDPCRRCSKKALMCVYEKLGKHVVVRTKSNPLDLDSSHTDGQNIDSGLHDTTASQESPELTGRFNVAIAGDEEMQAAHSITNPNLTRTEDNWDTAIHPSSESAHPEWERVLDITGMVTEDNSSFDMLNWPLTAIQPRMGSISQAPWSSWTTNLATHPPRSPSIMSSVFSFPIMQCLVPLQCSSPVIQHTTNLVIAALKSYPLMMTRRETLPPFIHAHWHCQGSPALPEPIANCMSVSQMFASRSDETRGFIWRTISAEGERILSQMHGLTPQDLLAAIQAQTIYMIMRFVDGGSEPIGLNQQLVHTYQMLCKQFMRTSGSMFCQVEDFAARPSWEDWIFAESRRRTACLFFLICGCISVDIGLPNCNVLERFGELPVASPKNLWEAKTRLEWEFEYTGYTVQENTIQTMGMLIEAHRWSQDLRESQMLDYWHGGADNLGNLLSTVASAS